ncbi:MAG: M48 family metallopeptidase [Candidatus Tyrphobacter sp.]
MKKFGLLLVGLTAGLALWAVASAGPTPWEAQQDRLAFESEQANLATMNSRQGHVVAWIAAKIGPVASRLYGTPIHYYLTKETDPNAYSYYGPRVYVSMGMVNLAQNREELAGVLCHESGHVLHHDGTRSAMETHSHNLEVNHLLSHHHATFAHLLSMGSNVVTLHFTQGQEYAADKAGATICSDAGINPWGLVWMLELFQRQPAYRTSRWSYLSDHPSNQARIKALTKYLKRNSQFATWSPDPRFATRI